MLFSLLVSYKTFSTGVYTGGRGGTSPIQPFLHPFVMIWNKKLTAESDIWYNISNKTLGRARDLRANGAWLNKLTE